MKLAKTGWMMCFMPEAHSHTSPSSDRTAPLRNGQFEALTRDYKSVNINIWTMICCGVYLLIQWL